MSSVLFSILAFIVALGILITVHEFGHYWVARRMGVKVLRFSIGFGRPLLRWVRGADRTEYVIAALPLGGYVKMLDAREGEVPADQRDREFTGKPLYARAAIVFAGPLFNFIFAFLAYWLIFTVGITGTKPVVGAVTPGSLAERAGIQVGEMITRIDGTPVQTWEQMMSGLMLAAVDGRDAELHTETGEHGIGHDRVLALHTLGNAEPSSLVLKIGMQPETPKWPPRVAQVTPDSAAQRGGLEPGDRIVQIDGRPVDDWSQVVTAIRAHPGETVLLSIERGADRTPMEIPVTPDAKEVGDERIGFLGVAPAPPSRDAIQPYLSKERYGLFGASTHAIEKLGEMTQMSLTMLGRMLMGTASLENLSGPITIADYAGKTASIGLAEYINFLALISLSLGIINLLPVPLLDGGHLFYYLIELIKGSPVSEQVEMMGQRIGIALLLTLMGIAFYNDIARLLN
jgi:regulator of sigma E protease